MFSIAFCLAQAFSHNWRTMVAFRFLLGIGIGPKSATIPIYASECAPANIRGALVMFWQFFTAFGIMLGYIFSAIFRDVLDGTNITLCHQPNIPPPTTSAPLPLHVQQRLLSIRCVSTKLATTCCALRRAVSNVRSCRADLVIHNRA